MQEYKLVSSNTYKDIANAWARILMRRESGTWIFSPLGGIHFLVQQFLHDEAIHTELFGDEAKSFLFLHIVVESESTESFTTILLNEVKRQLAEFVTAESIADVYSKLKSRQQTLVLIIEGIDWAIRSGKWKIIDDIYKLTVIYTDIKVLLLVWTDITDPEITSGNFGRFSTLLQNIVIYPRKGEEEADNFKHYLEENWHLQPTNEQKQWITENCGTSFRFIKETYRQLQNNPNLIYDELYTLPSLQFKARVLLDSFLEDQREVILRVATREPIPSRLGHPLEYLKKIEWVIESEGQLTLSVKYLEHYINISQKEGEDSRNLSPTEKHVFEYIQDHKGSIVEREEIAKVIWGNNFREKYSDWAIDQLMHRLKKKLAKVEQRIPIKTVRGKGFLLDS